MDSMNSPPAREEWSRQMAKERIVVFGERLVAEHWQRARERRAQQSEQRSHTNSPNVRIQAWEKLHGLRLPTDPAHPILELIAVDTRLTLDEVREVQASRSRP